MAITKRLVGKLTVAILSGQGEGATFVCLKVLLRPIMKDKRVVAVFQFEWDPVGVRPRADVYLCKLPSDLNFNVFSVLFISLYGIRCGSFCMMKLLLFFSNATP